METNEGFFLTLSAFVSQTSTKEGSKRWFITYFNIFLHLTFEKAKYTIKILFFEPSFFPRCITEFSFRIIWFINLRCILYIKMWNWMNESYCYCPNNRFQVSNFPRRLTIWILLFLSEAPNPKGYWRYWLHSKVWWIYLFFLSWMNEYVFLVRRWIQMKK